MKLTSQLIFLSVMLLLLCGTITTAQERDGNDRINLYFFWAEGCPHCSSEKEYLSTLQEKHPDLEIQYLEITRNRENAELLATLGEKLDVDVSGIPFTVVGEQYFIGWFSDETTGKAIEDAIDCAEQDHCTDIVAGLITPITKDEQPVRKNRIPEKITVPIIGDITTASLSLPLLTVVIAGLDGFNPCAMWVLFFLISLLFGMKDKKRLWIFGIVFIAASALVYFLFMAAWLRLFMFIGFVLWIRLIIGGVALVSAYINIKEYITNPAGGCKVTGEKKRQKVFEHLRKIIQERHIILAVIGLVLLAFAVNIVELLCSLGLPAVYTQTLALSNLAPWQYYAYLLLYVIVFSIPALFVFLAAVITLQLTGISSKYGSMTRLIGGIIMLIVGVLMIFKPEWLMFG